MDDQLNFANMFSAGRESIQKFDYYFLGVIIALLSLSIQTFNPLVTPKFIFLINIVWILLLVSMLSGFRRLEKIQLINHYDTRRIYEMEYEGEVANSLRIKKYYELSDELNKKSVYLYKIEKWSFIAALLVYLVFKLLNIYFTA